MQKKFNASCHGLTCNVKLHFNPPFINGRLCPPHDLAQRQLVAQPQPSDHANHVHCDHLVPPA